MYDEELDDVVCAMGHRARILGSDKEIRTNNLPQ
jgi:hypothetical protein